MAAADLPPHARRLLDRVRRIAETRIQLWAWPGSGAQRILLALAQEEGRKATILEPSPQGFVRRGPEVRWLIWTRPESPDEALLERFYAPGVRFLFLASARDSSAKTGAIVPPAEMLLTEAEVGELADRLTAGAVSSENVRRLWQASDGWLTPLEIALAAGAGTRRLEASSEGLLAVPAVAAFVRGEVVERLPPALAELVLELSAADNVSTELWRSVWREDETKLAGLAELRDGWGLILPGPSGVPRLPALLAAYLRQERARRWPVAQSFALCQQVAVWTYSRGQPAETAAALVQAVDPVRMAALLEVEWLELLVTASPALLRAALRLAPAHQDSGGELLQLAIEGAVGDRKRAVTGLAELAARLELRVEDTDPLLGALARALSAAVRGARQAPEVAAGVRRSLGARPAPQGLEELLFRLEGREEHEEEPNPPAQSVLAQLLRAGSATLSGAKTPEPATLESRRPVVEVRLLGLPRVTVFEGEASREVSWPLRKAFRLFAFLASAPQLEASQPELVEAVWSDEPSTHIERNFHPTLSLLRKALSGGKRERPRPLERHVGIYRLSSEMEWKIDVWEFEALVQRSRQRQEANDPHAAIDLGHAAWRLYQGPFLDGIDAPWIETRRERFRQDYVDLLRRLGDLLTEANDLTRALDAYRAGLIADPLQERVHAAVMRLYARQGRRDLLRRQYERLASLLREELRREPAPETLAEYHRLMG